MRAFAMNVGSQTEALRELAKLAQRSVAHPLVKKTAQLITSICPPRDEACELEAIFHAVHWWSGGNPNVPGLQHGVRYVHDPVLFDSFTAPFRLIEQGIAANAHGGSAAGDCDDMAALIASLAGVLGFTSGLRAWGPMGKDFQHVYAIVGMPKNNPIEWWGMDATVKQAYPGWEPPRGHVMNAIVAGDGSLK